MIITTTLLTNLINNYLPYYLLKPINNLTLISLTTTLLPTLILLSKFSSPIRYYLRLTTFLTGLGLASIWGVIVSLLLSLIPGQSKNINYVVARSFHGVVAPLVGFNFTVEGEEFLLPLIEKPAVVIGNHQTMLDILCEFHICLFSLAFSFLLFL